MTDAAKTTEGRIEIAPGIRVLEDGPGCWVVWDDASEECPVFDTKDRAILAAEQLAAERDADRAER